MADLASRAKGSKLRGSLQPEGEGGAQKEKVVRQIKSKDYPRSYRLDPEVMNTLKNTLDRINEATSRKVSEARLVKALIMMSRDISDEKIIKALKEVW